MDFRHFFPLVILVFPGIISSILQESPSTLKKAVITSILTRVINFNGIPDGQDTIAKETVANTEKPVQAFSKDMVIQVGAFRQEVNAMALRDRLAAILDKPVIILPEDGYFKVRIIRFANFMEIEKIIPTLGLLGYRNIWVFIPKKKTDFKPQVALQPDTSIKAGGNNDLNKLQDVMKRDTAFNPNDKKEENQSQVVVQPDTTLRAVVEKPVTEGAPITLQVAIFYKRSEALQAQRKIINKLNLPAEIVEEWNYYRVIIKGFHTKEETYKYYPELTKLGYPSSYMIESSNNR